MTRTEKALYHQIHPLKLLTDFTTSFASAWLLWQEEWIHALIVAFVPSIIVTVLLIGFVDLEPYKRSAIGVYVYRSMAGAAHGVRIAGQLVMWIGAATHTPWLLPLGLLIVAFGWIRGFWMPPEEVSSPARLPR